MFFLTCFYKVSIDLTLKQKATIGEGKNTQTEVRKRGISGATELKIRQCLEVLQSSVSKGTSVRTEHPSAS